MFVNDIYFTNNFSSKEISAPANLIIYNTLELMPSKLRVLDFEFEWDVKTYGISNH